MPKKAEKSDQWGVGSMVPTGYCILCWTNGMSVNIMSIAHNVSYLCTRHNKPMQIYTLSYTWMHTEKMIECRH